jgi:hypothetical protein
MYGYPSYEAGQAAERGEIVLGGCCIGGADPATYCTACHVSFAWRNPEMVRQEIAARGWVEEGEGPDKELRSDWTRGEDAER